MFKNVKIIKLDQLKNYGAKSADFILSSDIFSPDPSPGFLSLDFE